MRRWFRTIPLFLLLAAVVAGCDNLRDTLDRMRGRPLIYGAVINPPVPRPDVTMTDTKGQPFDLATATKGRVTFVAFGYTNCPDVCPDHMANLAGALRLLPPKERAQVSVVFITTDQVRDSLPQLRRWLDSFDPAFIGLRGTDAQLAAMERAFHIPPAQRNDQPGGGYSVTHSAEVFAFTPDDSAHVVYLPGMTGAKYAHDIPRLIRDDYQ